MPAMSKNPPPMPALRKGAQVQRFLAIERAAVDAGARTVELSFASETPYQRWWGIEVLDCSAQAVRLSRLMSGAPLLWNHNTDEQIGVVESVSIGADRVCRAVVRFGKGADAEEVFADVVDGIRKDHQATATAGQRHRRHMALEHTAIGQGQFVVHQRMPGCGHGGQAVEVGLRHGTGQVADAADVGGTLGHADRAARVQQVEAVAGLQ